MFFCFSVNAQSASSPSQLPPIQLALIEGMSGPFANTGEAVLRNLIWAVERVNARGGVSTQEGKRRLVLIRYDSKGQSEEALTSLRSAIDAGAQFVFQGNSSANAAALIDAIQKHNEREPTRRVLFLNYAAVDPSLTQDKCNFWHFRFDAHADMRMVALMQVLKQDSKLKSVYLIGQDYSFGQSVLREAKLQLEKLRPDIQIAGEELHPLGRVRDFLPYATKIKASGAQAVITGNWGNDLSLLVKAAKDVGYEGKFYTFYGNALGAPAAMGEAGVGRVLAVAEWMPNVPGAESVKFYQSFKQRFPKPAEDYLHLRMQLMMEALAQSIEKAGSSEPLAVALQLENAEASMAGQRGKMRSTDHQFQQPMVVAMMAKQGGSDVPFDVEGSGYGFKVVRQFKAQELELPSVCKMNRPN
ncbi:branched-chain amino acid ABC transporter substrate-binding protein [Limnohabitans sp. MMS-10A-178]|uniref:branched-chain amino acid ABC transporter substrate-binding protein n=1 Tax=Limnohabitans sp. MMS-10A-178 TaxID=1835767 RepID=UPI001E3CB3D2|nr:branched-chain amino acid ABC transporter substrate-binding protein [Limnohabitans sp. MMS-10A-178]